MSDSLRAGAVLSLLLLAVFSVPVEAQTPDFEVTSTTQSTFLIDALTKSFDVTVKNNHGSADIEQVKFSFTPTGGVDPISITVATATGWTTPGATDADSDGQNDGITMTGGPIAVGASATFTIEFAIDAGAADDTQVVLAASATDTTPDPDAPIGGAQNIPLNLQAAGLRFTSTTQLTLATETSSATRQVVLDAPPRSGETVTVEFASTDSTVATVTTSSLSFTSADWDTPQTFTIQAVSDDEVNSNARTATISATAASSRTGATDGYAAPGITTPTGIAVSVNDDDSPGIVVTETGGSTTVFEGGGTDSITVQLATKPSATTNVSLTLGSSGQATLSKSVLTFTATNWATPQTVTFTAVDDTTVEALATNVGLTIAVGTPRASEYTGIFVFLEVVVVDNEGVGITVEETDGATTVNEAPGQRSDTFMVSLADKPYTAVTLTVATASTDISVLPAQLTFTPQNWDVPKAVTVTAIDDDIPEATESATVTLTVAATSSGEYLAVAAKTVTVTIIDDDHPGFTVAESGGSTVTTEAGGTDTVTVVLTEKPESNVVITITSQDTDEVQVTGPAPTGSPPVHKLTFTSTNWNLAQPVTLTGQDDDLSDGHQDVMVVFAVDDAASDANWADAPDQNVTVTNKDDEPVVMARPSSVPIKEGETGTYQLSLTVQPTSDVTVTIDAGDVDVDRSTVTFTTADWDTARTITVTVPDDAVRGGAREETIEHSILATGNYATAPGEDVTIQIEDDDTVDLGAQNRALQRTVKVTRSDGENRITWDITVVAGDPAGIQVWRAESPFFIIASADNGTSDYRQGRYVDDGGTSSSRYIVTVYYGDDEESGFFRQGQATLDQVAGYEGVTEAEQDDLGVELDEDDNNTLLVVGIVVALLILVAIVVLIILLRRKKEDWEEEPEEDWDRPAEATQAEHVPEDTPDAPADEWDDWDEWDEPAAAELAEEAPEPETEESWEDAPVYHLTCPRCDQDFDVQGHKPFETECPNCGVTGVLR